MADERRRVTWTAEAHSNLTDAILYIAEASRQGARTVAEQAVQAAESLSTLSERGRIVPEQKNPMVRELFVGRFRLMYRITPSEILILSFLHGARDFARLRKRQ